MEDYNSKYTGEEVEQLLDQVAKGETLTEADIANMGFTKNVGTITEVKMNGVSKGTSGVVDLGDVPTKEQFDEQVEMVDLLNYDVADLTKNKQDSINDLEAIRDGASKGATAVQSDDLMWVKVEGEAGVRLKGTNGTATGNLAISAGDDKTASDGTAYPSAASGDHAVAFGYGNTCAGRSTLAQGLYNIVNGKDSVAFGQRNTVNGDQAFAAGQLNEVTTRLGVTLGYKNKATNTNSIAIGYQNTSGGSGSVALGDTCESSGTSSTAMGYKTKATGAYSATFGENTQATNNGEVAMGVYNKSTTSTDVSQQTSFSFGIGTSDTNRANALEIKKNGDVYIGDRLASEFITVDEVATVATSGSYNDLSDKPTIPAEQVNADWNATSGKAQILNKPTIPSAVTESTVSGWGFTKNTGTYSKPSGGIPKSDLASDVQSALDNAVTRDKYGDLETIQTQGFEGSLSGKLYALPDEATSDEDDILLSRDSVKTINGQSILGSGNITIEGGGSSGGGKEVVMVDEVWTIAPNTIYVLDNSNIGGSENISIGIIETSNALIDEYAICFKTCEDGGFYMPILSLPSYVRWANGISPTIDFDTLYELSIVKTRLGDTDYFKAVLTSFK